MNEIVQFKSDTGLDVQITAQDVQNIICPGATPKEVAYFLELCRAQRLNPWVKDAYLVKYGNAPASIITGKETFTKRANSNPNFEGYEAGISYVNKSGQVCQREGSAVYSAAGETLVGGWCRVYIKGRRPFYDEVSLAEYSTGKSGWSKMPATMIRKVALVHALREAMPESFQGLYAAEEMGKAGEVEPPRIEHVPERNAQESQPERLEFETKAEALDVEAVEMATDAQYVALEEAVEELSNMRGVPMESVRGFLFASSTMRNTGAVEGVELTASQAETALRLLGHWIAKAKPEKVQEQVTEVGADALNAAISGAESALGF